MASNNSNKKIITMFATLFLAVLLVSYVLKFDAVKEFAGQFLDLNESDLWFTPIFGLLFFVFFKLFDKVFFRDYLDFLAKREALTSDITTNLSGMLTEAENLEKVVADEVSSKQANLQKRKDSTIKDKKAELEDKIRIANESAEKNLKAQRQSLNAEILEVESQIEMQSDSLSESLVSKVLQPSEKIGMIQ